MLDKSRGLSVDSVVYDLEDSVSPNKKQEARIDLVRFLNDDRPENIREIAVRINSVDSGYALDDLTAIVKTRNLDAIAVPKVQNASDMHFVTDLLQHLDPQRHPMDTSTSAANSDRGTDTRRPIKLLALIESALGLHNLSQICTATPYISALVFAAEDFCLDLNITRSPGLPELLYARSQIVATARAFGIESIIDLVCTSFKGEDGQKALGEECDAGRNLGFTGKQCIHPAQIETVQRKFGPGEKEVEWAVRVVVAAAKTEKEGRGAWTLDGSMVDKPVIGRANGVVVMAEGCGFDVKRLKEKWKGQEPE